MLPPAALEGGGGVGDMGWMGCTLGDASSVGKMIPAGVESLLEGGDPGWKTDRKKQGVCACVCVYIHVHGFGCNS